MLALMLVLQSALGKYCVKDVSKKLHVDLAIAISVTFSSLFSPFSIGDVSTLFQRNIIVYTLYKVFGQAKHALDYSGLKLFLK